MFDEDCQTELKSTASVPLGKQVAPGYASPSETSGGCVCFNKISQRSRHRDGCVQDGGLRGLTVLHLL